MKLTFLSNYYTHHQAPLCENWYKLTNNGFAFIETESFAAERKQMGWEESNNGSFVYPLGSLDEKKKSVLVDTADAVVFGSAPLSMVQKRLDDKKVVFKYSERVFKSGYSYWKWLPRVVSYRRLYGRHKHLYLLAASAFATADFAKHGTFKSKSYKWGYFPETKRYDDIKMLVSSKKSNKILWCGRFIDWKHPEAALEAAKRLKVNGYDFELDFIGVGGMEEDMQRYIAENGLEGCVKLLGAMKPWQVRANMETAGIYLFTSDFNEGWGVVLNEAMNSGCAVVASHAIGAVPFLVKHKQNGLVYKNGDTNDLYVKIKSLLDKPDMQKQLGVAAYSTIVNLWNAEIAAERFVLFAEEISKRGSCDLFEDGPCSRAKAIKNNWFKEDKYGV